MVCEVCFIVLSMLYVRFNELHFDSYYIQRSKNVFKKNKIHVELILSAISLSGREGNVLNFRFFFKKVIPIDKKKILIKLKS